MNISINDLNNIDLKGKVICFPTDTVYGVGCIIDDEEAIKKIYSLKHRDLNKPLAILTPGIKDIIPYVKDINNIENELMEKYWPGALTIIFDKNDNFNSSCLCGNSTIGLRMPNSNIALKVLNRFGLMATTSVNISNNPPLNSLEEIRDTFGDLIDYYIIDKEPLSCVSSTVVLIKDNKINVSRQGNIKF